MSIYLYPSNTETEISNAYIGIPYPESITLDKSSISLSNVGDTVQLTATLEPTVCDQSITWSSDDTTVATVSTTGLVTCVTPGDCTITATTVNGLTATCGVRTAKLPSAYQEVEWIENTGTSYINTGYVPTVNTEIETDISWGSQTETWGVFWGVTGNDRSSDGILGRIYDGNATTYNPWFCNSSYSERRVTVTTNVFHNITLKKNGGAIDGSSYSVTTSGTPYQSAMDIFAGNNGGTHGWRCGQCKIKTFKISESGTLGMDLVPCYRKADSVIGMYDVVNDQFYTNSGSGTFTKGQDV